MKFDNGQIVIAITGPDGSGKSTACARAAELLRQGAGEELVSVCSIWDALAGQSVFSSKQAVGEYLTQISGEVRAYFLFHAMLQSLHLAQKKKPRILVVDGYFYKYAVSELAYGVPMETLLGAAVAFPKPSKTFLLSVDPHEAWKRKSATSAYERGEGADSEAAFLEFQRKMAGHWSAAEKSWGPWQKIQPENAESVAQVVFSECMKLKEAI